MFGRKKKLLPGLVCVSTESIVAAYDALRLADNAYKPYLDALYDELDRRGYWGSPSHSDEVPGWLRWLPGFFWHTKAVGEGRGSR